MHSTQTFKLPTDQLPVVKMAGRSLRAVTGQLKITELDGS
jgi:hypothetical protein